jgi:hypothetical protein
MAPKLPKTVYIRWAETDLPADDDNQFLMEYRTLEEVAEKGVTHTVGVYELKETKKVTLKVTEEVIEHK